MTNRRCPGLAGAALEMNLRVQLALSMNAAIKRGAWLIIILLAGLGSLEGYSQERSGGRPRIEEVEGAVEVAKGGSDTWMAARANQLLYAGDRLRTDKHGRAVIRLSSLSTLRVGPLSLIRMPLEGNAAIRYLRGLFYYFHRDKPMTLPVETPTVAAVVRGTEFNLRVGDDGSTELSVLDGIVEMSNEHGEIKLISGQTGEATARTAPEAKQTLKKRGEIVQWALYYPAVLVLGDLQFTNEEKEELSTSLELYRVGNLRAALEAYPNEMVSESIAVQLFRAALLASAGSVQEAGAILVTIGPEGKRVGIAIETLINSVKFEGAAIESPTLSTEWLAQSYNWQSKFQLDHALKAAKEAVAVSPGFGFGWARVAELEFSFGRLSEAKIALANASRFVPAHAPNYTLQGFLFTANYNLPKAMEAFEKAISIDPSYGTAWLGRGLLNIRRGELETGRQDIQMAATLEPQRSLFRSYLGKAFSEQRDLTHAAREFDLAKKLDPHDPTAYLYSGLLRAQQNQINEAIRDMQKAKELNNNRELYRSRLLLDQDLAVQSVNLARLYQDAGMDEVALREAGRGVTEDYSSFAAHLFLANSFNNLRDPSQLELRYETAYLTEYLVANLLAPAAVGTLSPVVSQNEYSRLFDRDRIGLASESTFFSSGDWTHSSVQYGNYGGSSYSLEAVHRSQGGDYPNTDFESTGFNLRLKQFVGPKSSLYFQASYYDLEAGDVTPHYEPSRAQQGFRVSERQEPLLMAGFHHQWQPGIHTLFLLAQAPDELRVSNPAQSTLILDRSLTGGVDDVIPVSFNQRYISELELNNAEIQQIWQTPGNTVIAGGRVQEGELELFSSQSSPMFPIPLRLRLANTNRFQSDYKRLAFYLYDYLQIHEQFRLIGGISYDQIEYPSNFRYAPINAGRKNTRALSPKGGFIFKPWRGTVARGAYTRNIGGITYDQSFRLEPSQIAGFNQAFRSIIPESAVGANSAAEFETAAVSLEQQIGGSTFFGLSGEFLWSSVERQFGVFNFVPPIRVGETIQRLDYRERCAVASIHQLLGANWTVGSSYRVSEAELDQNFIEIPSSSLWAGGFLPRQEQKAMLHQVELFAVFNHRNGLFARGDSIWVRQSDSTNIGASEEFLQINAFAGYRFARRKGEVRVGLLNITGQDYRLAPLNLSTKFPRELTAFCSITFNL